MTFRDNCKGVPAGLEDSDVLTNATAGARCAAVLVSL